MALLDNLEKQSKLPKSHEEDTGVGIIQTLVTKEAQLGAAIELNSNRVFKEGFMFGDELTRALLEDIPENKVLSALLRQYGAVVKTGKSEILEIPKDFLENDQLTGANVDPEPLRKILNGMRLQLYHDENTVFSEKASKPPLRSGLPLEAIGQLNAYVKKTEPFYQNNAQNARRMMLGPKLLQCATGDFMGANLSVTRISDLAHSTIVRSIPALQLK